MLTGASKALKNLWAVIVRNVISSSSRGRLNSTDFLKILRNALFVGTSASVVFVIENVADSVLTSVGQGLIIALMNGIVDTITRLIKNNKEKVDDSEGTEPKV